VICKFNFVALDPTVVNVSVAFTGLLFVIETGVVLPKEQVGAFEPETTGAILQESVTFPVNPFAGVTVTLACDELPGLTVAGFGVPAVTAKLEGDVTVRLSVAVFVRLPDVPVIVTAVGPPAVAVLVAVNVNVLVVAVEVGLKAAVTPLGSVDVTARLTLPVNTPVGLTVIVPALLPPCATLREEGAASVKLGGPVTVKLTVVVCVRLPEVPVIVTAVGPPIVAVPLAVSVSVLEFVGLVVLVGLKAAVTPLGRPEATRLTAPVNPPEGVTVIVLVPLLPCATLREPGLDESVKPGPLLVVLPDSVSASTKEKFVLSVFARAMLCTVRVESSVNVYE
jgi:hypothetical protein